jgi:hypothetical protein
MAQFKMQVAVAAEQAVLVKQHSFQGYMVKLMGEQAVLVPHGLTQVLLYYMQVVVVAEQATSLVVLARQVAQLVPGAAARVEKQMAEVWYQEPTEEQTLAAALADKETLADHHWHQADRVWLN